MIKENIEKLKKLSPELIVMHILSRFFLGIGAGILIVYLFELNLLWGFYFVLIAVIFSIPSSITILKNRKKVRKK